MNTDLSIKTTKAADLDNAIPGLSKAWKKMKEECGSKQRTPKRITLSTRPQQMMLDDGYLGKRFTLNLATMEVGGGIHVSSGEWACHGGNNHDQEIHGVPENMAVVDCEWSDYYRVFIMRIQVNEKNLPKALPQAT